MTTPNTTDAITIAIVDRMRLVREFILIAAPYAGWKTLAAIEVLLPLQPPSEFQTNKVMKCFVVDGTRVPGGVLNRS